MLTALFYVGTLSFSLVLPPLYVVSLAQNTPRHLTFMNIACVLDEIIIMRGLFASLWQMSLYKSTSGGSPNGVSPRYSAEISHNNPRNNFPAARL